MAGPEAEQPHLQHRNSGHTPEAEDNADCDVCRGLAAA